MERSFKPYGHTDGMLEPQVIHAFELRGRKMVVCEYGFMIAVFDYITGGKIHDINITKYPLKANREYINIAIKRASDTLDLNPNWQETLNSLPLINQHPANV